MKQNRFIKIVTSQELIRMKLEGLTGRRGLVVEELVSADRRDKGFMVLLEEAFEDEFIWFIPQKSVSDE